MLRPGLFGRPCRGIRAQPVKGDPSAAEKRSIGQLPGILEKFLSMVFFMVLPFSRKISY